MFNMIRGDTYRLLHSKGFYITEFLLIILVLTSVLTGTLGTVGVQTESLAKMQDVTSVWNAVKAMKLMTIMASFLIYLILPLFIMTTGFEFSRRSYKNLLSSGMTRLNYFFVKICRFYHDCLPSIYSVLWHYFFRNWLKKRFRYINGKLWS